MPNEPKEAVNEDDKNIPSETPAEEENVSEVEESEVTSEKTETSTEEPKAEDKKVTGAEKRIHKLVEEKNKAKAEVQSLEEKLAEHTSGQVPQEGETPPQFTPDNEGAERELTIDDLRTIVRLENERSDTVRRINSEALEAVKTYPELDKKSDQFDTDVNDAVTTAVWLEIQKDPSKSVIKLTEKYMRPYKGAAERAVSKEKKNLTKQVSEGALKPVTVKSVDKTLDEKTIEELEAELETVY